MLKLLKDDYLHGFFLRVVDVPNHPDYPEHSHEFDELVIVYEGFGINQVNGIDYQLSGGDVFIIHAGQEHSYSQTENLHLVNIVFDADRLKIRKMDMRHLPGFHALFVLEPSLRKRDFNSRLRLNLEQLIQIRAMVDEMERELDEAKPGFRLISQSLFFLLAGKLSRWYEGIPGRDPAKLLRIAKAISFMEQQFYEPISIERLAEISGMSVRSFHRIFQQATGSPPLHYLTDIRITHVAELLVHSDDSITSIAFECGFQDSSYMTKQFKTHTGMTPSLYRKTKR